MATTASAIAAAGRRSRAGVAAAAAVAIGLVVATLAHLGADANGVAWALVQVLLVFVAWFDLMTRRILNVVVVPAAVAVVVARVAFSRGAVAEMLVAGVVAVAVFLVLAIIVRGGLGMGDVKLAGLEGLLFGSMALRALLLGVVLGGVAAVVLIATRRASRQTTYAYGPYLAFGAAISILVWHPPPLL